MVASPAARGASAWAGDRARARGSRSAGRDTGQDGRVRVRGSPRGEVRDGRGRDVAPDGRGRDVARDDGTDRDGARVDGMGRGRARARGGGVYRRDRL